MFTTLSLCEEYRVRFASSAECAAKADDFLAGGGTHDAWNFDPFPVFFEKARGPYKWTVDGCRLIDYWMGHGALLCGHSFSPVVEAIRRQALESFHFGGPHPMQVRWAELVCSLLPGAERVRFTASGTEATLLAFRIARAVTGRNVILRIDGHFHGWHDHALAHSIPSDSAGIAVMSVDEVALAEAGSLDLVAELLDGDVAAVILEPGGGGTGSLPWSPDFLAELHLLTRRNGSLLIFDEVVSGFRYSPGGVQKLCGVMPELTLLGKILCGGLPGGAVAGDAAVMQGFGLGTSRNGRSIRIPHTGTFNANPMSAAGGIAMLEYIADGVPQTQASDLADQLVCEVNESAAAVGVDVGLYQGAAIFHILIGAGAEGYPIGPSAGTLLLPRQHPNWYASLRRALLLEGVDAHPVHGWVSTVHTSDVIRETGQAFARAFERVKREQDFPMTT